MSTIYFFANAEDEIKLFNKLKQSNEIYGAKILDNSIEEFEDLKSIELPDFHQGFKMCVWNKGLGEVNWFTEKPKLDHESHSKFKYSFFARKKWEEMSSTTNTSLAMINSEFSPILEYNRSGIYENKHGVSSIVSSQSSIDILGSDFKNWYNRIYSWIRRNGETVHSWNKKSDTLENRFNLLNTVYALNGAIQEIEKYRIS